MHEKKRLKSKSKYKDQTILYQKRKEDLNFSFRIDSLRNKISINSSLVIFFLFFMFDSLSTCDVVVRERPFRFIRSCDQTTY